MLDPYTLAQISKISLDQELIEYAYDNDAPSFEITNVVSMTCVDSFITLISDLGLVLIIQNQKLK